MKKIMRRVWRPLILALPLIPLAMLVAVVRAEPTHEREMILLKESETLDSEFDLVRYYPDTQQYRTLASNISHIPDSYIVIRDMLYYITDGALWRFDLTTSQFEEIMRTEGAIRPIDKENEWLLINDGEPYALLNTLDHTIFQPFPTFSSEMTIKYRAILSPDRESIAFDACTGSLCDVYIVRLDGTGLFNVTSAIEPSVLLQTWVGTDMGWIILRIDNEKLYKIRPNGKGFEKLTANEQIGGWEYVGGKWEIAPYQDWIVVDLRPYTDFAPRRAVAAISNSLGINLNDSSLQWTTPQKRLLTLAPSPDGQWLSFVENGQLYRVHPDGTGVTPVATLPNENMMPITWSHDGQWLYLDEFVSWDELNLYRILVGSDELVQIATIPGSYRFYQWSPDNEWMVFIEDNGGLESRGALWVKVDGSQTTSDWAKLPNNSAFVAWGDTYEVERSSTPLYGFAGATVLMAIVAGFFGIYRPYRKAHRLQIGGDTAGQ